MDRRSFLVGVTAGSLTASMSALPLSTSVRYRLTANAIEVLRDNCLLQRVVSASPVCPIEDRSRGVLFVANHIAHFAGMPAASVESYAIDAITGKLRLVSRQMLSLACVLPTHMALASDSVHLLVHSVTTGITNVLPVSPEGEIEAVKQAMKMLTPLAEESGTTLFSALRFANGELRHL